MRNRHMRFIAVLATLGVAAPYAGAAPVIGKPAPAFSGHGSDYKTYNLADFQGKFVVLEWYNPRCPFVRKHYDSGNMQKLQETYTAKGVIWLEIDSNAPGKEGYMIAKEAEFMRTKEGSKATATLLDPDNKIAL